MDDHRFDVLTRNLAGATDRRGLMASLGGLLTGLVGAQPAVAQPRTPCRRLGQICRPRPGLRCCPGTVCRAGRCACPRRQRRCRGRCIGANQCCGKHCPGGTVCRRGRCQCPARKKRCQGRCIPRAACCRNGECGPGQVCRQGRCRCAPGFQPCQGGCIPDAACCGCPPGGVCRAGQCCAIGTAAALQAALGPGGPAIIQLCPDTVYPGSFTIARDVTIIGAGATSSVLDGGNVATVVAVEFGVTAELRGLGIRNGLGGTSESGGGGVFNDGDLTLTGCRIANNTTIPGTNGAGIRNRGTVTLDGTEVVTNTSGQDGGGIWNVLGTTLILRNGSRVTDNEATRNGGGIVDLGGTVTLRDSSSVSDNTAVGNGGGFFYSPPFGATSELRLEGTSVVAENTATTGGAIFVGGSDTRDVTFLDEACVRDNSEPQCVGTTSPCPICPA